MSDIVERLRRAANYDQQQVVVDRLDLTKAADEIERLRQALTVVLKYPGLRKYVGSLVYNQGLAALGLDHDQG